MVISFKTFVVLAVQLLISGCTAFSSGEATCNVNITQKKTILGDEETGTTCTCTCPSAQKSTVLDALGTIGGLANLFWVNN